MTLRGLGTAMVTPFDKEKNVDYPALQSLVEQQILSGTDFLVLLGTTAETCTLSEDEQERVVRTAIETANGRVPIVVGVGGNGTRRVVSRLTTMDTQGITAILSVCPYYNKPSQEGLYEHFREIAGASPLPVLLYNVPARTAVNMLPETTLRIARDCPNVIGIKEASGIVSQIDMIIKQRPEGFLVFSGDDTIAYPLVAMGADGVVSVLGNAFPKEFGEMIHHALDGQLSEALPIHHRFKDMYPLLFKEGNPCGIKCLMALRQQTQEYVRLPLVPVSEALREEMTLTLEEIVKGL